MLIRVYLGIISLLLPLMATAMENNTVRLAVVNTPYQSGLMAYLLEGFEEQSEMTVELYHGEDVYQRAEQGKADLVIAHYGKEPLAHFVMEGYGSWPKMVFSNQLVIVGPADDPAAIGGLSSASAAFGQIASGGHPFVVNNIAGLNYLTEILWSAAGKPTKTEWYRDSGLAKGQAMKAADKDHAYTVWGAIPFLTFKQKQQTDLIILVSQDPLLQRVMAVTRVNPDKIAGVNAEGAKQLEAYLLKPETQAKIAAFRGDNLPMQLWWPAGRHN